jgi:hypothetical protein
MPRSRRRKLYGAAAASYARRRRRNPRGLGGGSITPEMIEARHARMRAAKYARSGASFTPRGVATHQRAVAKKHAALRKRARARKARMYSKLFAAPKRKRARPSRRVSRTSRITTGRKKTMAAKRSSRSKAAKKGARTKARMKARRSAASKRGARKRRGRKHNPGHTVRRRKRRRNPAATMNPRRKRRRARRHNPGHAVRRRRHRARRRNPVSYRGPRRGGRYARRSSPLRRKHHRGPRRGGLYRKRIRNPFGPMVGGMVEVMKQALPMAASLYGARFIINKFGPSVPGVNQLGTTWTKPVLSGALLGAGMLFTGAGKLGFLRKWRFGILAGLGINVIDSVVSALAPPDIKAMVGLAGMGEYMTLSGYPPISSGMGEYVQFGTNQEMGDYIEVGTEEDLGALQSELGLESELGDDPATVVPSTMGTPLMGGAGSMIQAVPTTAMVAAVPGRSFTSEVQPASAQYDKQDRLATGIFAGGFGC